MHYTVCLQSLLAAVSVVIVHHSKGAEESALDSTTGHLCRILHTGGTLPIAGATAAPRALEMARQAQSSVGFVTTYGAVLRASRDTARRAIHPATLQAIGVLRTRAVQALVVASSALVLEVAVRNTH